MRGELGIEEEDWVLACTVGDWDTPATAAAAAWPKNGEGAVWLSKTECSCEVGLFECVGSSYAVGPCEASQALTSWGWVWVVDCDGAVRKGVECVMGPGWQARRGVTMVG